MRFLNCESFMLRKRLLFRFVSQHSSSSLRRQLHKYWQHCVCKWSFTFTLPLLSRFYSLLYLSQDLLCKAFYLQKPKHNLLLHLLLLLFDLFAVIFTDISVSFYRLNSCQSMNFMPCFLRTLVNSLDKAPSIVGIILLPYILLRLPENLILNKQSLILDQLHHHQLQPNVLEFLLNLMLP